MTTAILTVSPRVFAGFLKIAPKADVRYYLRGIFVEPDTGVMTATDGHAMLAHLTGARVANVAPFIIPNALLANAVKAKCHAVRISIAEGPAPAAAPAPEARAPRMVTLECGTGQGEAFEPSGATFTAPEIVGRYPEWRRVVPTKHNDTACAFDPCLLERVYAAMAEVCETRKNARFMVSIQYNGPQNAALVHCERQDVFAVVMPWRDGINDAPDTMLEAFGLIHTRAPQTQTEPEALAEAA
jgi:hypothetical protein